jgi:hypothetical protein
LLSFPSLSLSLLLKEGMRVIWKKKRELFRLVNIKRYHGNIAAASQWHQGNSGKTLSMDWGLVS